MRSPLTIIVACIILIVLIKATYSIHQKAVVSDAKLAQARVELVKLQARNNDLDSQVSELSTDQGIETELRTKYRAVRDGESVAVITGDAGQAAATVEASTTVSVGWWHGLWSWFGL